MDGAIKLAQESSIQSMVNRNVFAAAYWQHRSYKASRLPSLNLQASLLNVDRSIVPLQNYDTGAWSYRPVFTLSNDMSMFLQQRISATGGTVSLMSSLRRFDQFNPDDLTWYSQPITLQYTQPLFGYNSYKWDKRIEPHAYQRARLEYVENMESVTINAAAYFWNLVMARLDREIAADNYQNSRRLYRIAEERHKLGSVKRDEVLQLELRVLNDSLAINTAGIAYTTQKNRLASFLGLREDAGIEPEIEYDLPAIALDYEQVMATALRNSSLELRQRIELLEAERSVAQARANRGVDVSFNARFGMSQSGESVSRAYSHLRDQQVAGFSVSVPILDWGMGRGRVRMAQSAAETVRYRHEQAMVDFRQDVLMRVMEFNAQRGQCEASRRAEVIAGERFDLSVDNFTRGTLSVTELNTAQSEKDAARRTYISNLREYWDSYFNLRKISLYDYLSGTDIGAAFTEQDYNELVK